ncbi:Cytochrome P450 [Brevibacterium sandarakinum]|uniref:Cytochrome P450 n=1 Tax=Brevibacterium sandarakinum TaxID=629680 RepID=A0A1H1SKG2_BRESA|nr:cytochrome P450 [Brevibacterium sandarakinum]SDS48328.1 Cytochrome P450 [Brevibacterium sandarakinum]
MSVDNTVPRIDHLDLEALGDGLALDNLAATRSYDRPYWNPETANGPGFWTLSDYQGVKDAANDNARLSSAQGTQVVDRKVEGKYSSIHNMDDPEHGELKMIAMSFLRSRKIKQWQSAIEEIVDVLLDDSAAQPGEFDLVDIVTARLPMMVIARVLGVPKEDAPKMVDWANRMTSSDPDERVDTAALEEARNEVMDYFKKLTEERREVPQDDLVSVIANAEIQTGKLSWGQLAAYYIVLVAAGNETTRHLVSGGILALNDNPEALRQMQQDHGLVIRAVEEMIRFVSPVAAMRRTALEDMTIGDQHIKAGDRVVLFFNGANRDPEVFEDPDTFDINRHGSNQHLGFGSGVHFCLGSHLARAEVQTFFTRMLDRGYRFDVVGEPTRVRHYLFTGWSHIPVKLTHLT